jgi:hypothetical protein
MQWFVIAVSLTLLAGCSVQERNKTLAGKADMRLAEVAMANGMPQTALSVTREILESDPRNIAALLHQGDALVAMGQSDAAEPPRSTRSRWTRCADLAAFVWRWGNRKPLKPHSARRSSARRMTPPHSTIWGSRSICRSGTVKPRPPRGGRR